MFNFFKIKKENLLKVITALIVACVFFLLISVLTDGNQSHKQITSNTKSEDTLCSILSDIKGVGEVDAMISYDESKVSGVIVTASGAGDPVVKNNIIKGVSTLFHIEETDVVVYEKKQEDL